MSTRRACFHLLFIFIFLLNFVAVVVPSRVIHVQAAAPCRPVPADGVYLPMLDMGPIRHAAISDQ